MTLKWFEGPAIIVIDWAKAGVKREVNSLERAAEELSKWPKTKKRDRAADLIGKAYRGAGKMEAAEKAFEQAAKEAKVLLPRRV